MSFSTSRISYLNFRWRRTKTHVARAPSGAMPPKGARYSDPVRLAEALAPWVTEVVFVVYTNKLNGRYRASRLKEYKDGIPLRQGILGFLAFCPPPKIWAPKAGPDFLSVVGRSELRQFVPQAEPRFLKCRLPKLGLDFLIKDFLKKDAGVL